MTGGLTRQSDVGRLERVLMMHPSRAWVSQDVVDRDWQSLAFTARPDLTNANREFDALVSLIERHGARVELVGEADSHVFDPASSGLDGPSPLPPGLDAIYTRDASILCDRGAILCRMGKTTRQAEPGIQEQAFARMAIPVIGRIEGPGTLEGGDVYWLDASTLAVGRGYRTNDEGIAQLRALLGPGIEVVVVPLPHWKGPDDVFHLMSVVSPLAADLALVYSPLLPVPFRELLLERGTRLVEVPDEEFDSMAGNVLALSSDVCVALSGNPITKGRMEDAGITVQVIDGIDISAKGCGGPTCLTRPLERAG